MGEPALKRATYGDILAAPEYLVAELIHGNVVTSPRPAPRHTNSASVLGMDLGSPFQRGKGGPGGWWILSEPELHLFDGEEVLVPDLAAWRFERMPKMPETAYFTVVPDWICEVLSPSTEAIDRADKMPIYSRACVKHAWLVNPLLTTLEVYRLERESWMLTSTFRGDAAIHVEPFDAIELELGGLWRGPEPAAKAEK